MSVSGSSLLPTLTVRGNHNRKGKSEKSGDGLTTCLGGPPHPTFLEWFMGFPAGWTASGRLATASSPRRPRWSAGSSETSQRVA